MTNTNSIETTNIYAQQIPVAGDKVYEVAGGRNGNKPAGATGVVYTNKNGGLVVKQDAGKATDDWGTELKACSRKLTKDWFVVTDTCLTARKESDELVKAERWSKTLWGNEASMQAELVQFTPAWREALARGMRGENPYPAAA